MSFSISKHSEQKNGSFIFTDFYPANNEKVALLFHSLEPRPLYENAVKIALETFHKEFYDENIRENTLDRLEKSATEINWQISGFLTRCGLRKFPLSAMFLIIKQDCLYLIQFGRIMVAVVHNGQFIELGNKWKEFHLKMEDEVQMLGHNPEHAEIRIIKQQLCKNDVILAVPYSIARQFDTNKTSRFSYIKQFNNLVTPSTTPMLMIEVEQDISIQPKEKKRKFHFSTRNIAIFMAAVAVIATCYVFFGKNQGEDYLYTGKEILKESSKKINFEKIDETFPIATKLFLPQVYQPKLSDEWEITLPFVVSHPPLFDYENIYLIDNNRIFCFKKNNRKISWIQEFDFPIPCIKLLGNRYLLVNYDRNQFYCLNKANGKIVWTRQASQHFEKPPDRDFTKPVFIDYERDRRLQYLYFITKDDKDILLFNGETGELVDKFSMKSKIKFISEYDYIMKSIYITNGNNLICLKLEIK